MGNRFEIDKLAGRLAGLEARLKTFAIKADELAGRVHELEEQTIGHRTDAAGMDERLEILEGAAPDKPVLPGGDERMVVMDANGAEIGVGDLIARLDTGRVARVLQVADWGLPEIKDLSSIVSAQMPNIAGVIWEPRNTVIVEKARIGLGCTVRVKGTKDEFVVADARLRDGVRDFYGGDTCIYKEADLVIIKWAG